MPAVVLPVVFKDLQRWRSLVLVTKVTVSLRLAYLCPEASQAKFGCESNCDCSCG